MQEVVQMQQVHGENAVVVGLDNAGEKIPRCDALITNDQDVALCVRVADCLPIFIFDPMTGAKALIHAGWRGLEKKLINKTIKKMHSGLKIQNMGLKIFIGPHICQKHYEVGTDVSQKFEKYKKAIKKIGSKKFLDLGLVAMLQLLESGISPDNIQIDDVCTFEDKKLFSFRRNKTKYRNVFIF